MTESVCSFIGVISLCMNMMYICMYFFKYLFNISCITAVCPLGQLLKPADAVSLGFDVVIDCHTLLSPAIRVHSKRGLKSIKKKKMVNSQVEWCNGCQKQSRVQKSAKIGAQIDGRPIHQACLGSENSQKPRKERSMCHLYAMRRCCGQVPSASGPLTKIGQKRNRKIRTNRKDSNRWIWVWISRGDYSSRVRHGVKVNLTLWRAAFDLVPPTGDYDVCINIHDVYQLATTPARKPDPRLWGAVHSYIHMLVQLIIGFFFCRFLLTLNHICIYPLKLTLAQNRFWFGNWQTCVTLKSFDFRGTVSEKLGEMITGFQSDHSLNRSLNSKWNEINFLN